VSERGSESSVVGAAVTSVASDELYAAAEQLRKLALEAVALRDQLVHIDNLVSYGELHGTHGPADAARAKGDIEQGVIVMYQLEAAARAFNWGVTNAADGYDWIEGVIQAVGKELLGTVAPTSSGIVGSELLKAVFR
jgi:hypothetical protein